MNSLINRLENSGMLFDTRCDKISASDYLTYNVTYSSLSLSLKQFSNTIKYNQDNEDKIYHGLYFYDLIQAGLLDYYYNETIKTLLNEFEQLFKNYFLEIFFLVSDGEQDSVIGEINLKHNFNKFINNSFEITTIHDLFTFVTLGELIDLFNNLLYKKQALIPYLIPQSFAAFFKEVINNKGLTLFVESSEHINFDHVGVNFGFFDNDQIKYLEVNPYNNSCYLAVQLIKLTYILQSRHDSLKVRRQYTKDNLIKNMEKCNTSLSKTNKFDSWVISHFEILQRTIRETYLING